MANCSRLKTIKYCLLINSFKVVAPSPMLSPIFLTTVLCIILHCIDLCHSFEYLMLALCKYQKWKEKVRISKYRQFGDLILKTMTFVKLLKIENLTKNIWEFYVGRALPRYHAFIHSPLKFWSIFSFQKPHHCHSFQC